MADQKITELTELTTVADDDVLAIVDTDAGSTKKITRDNLVNPPVFLTTPLTSTSWDGDSFSTTSKTLIDLSAVFGVPAGVKAVLVRIAARDSASASNSSLFMLLSPNADSGGAAICRPSGLPNDYYAEQLAIVPCDTNGDIYYQVAASGSGTMDVTLQIWGYWL